MLKKLWDKLKKIPLIKGKLLAGVLVITALILNYGYSGNGDENADKSSEKESTSQSETAKEKKEFHIGASNAVMLAACAAALAYVKHRDNNIGKK